MGYDLALVQRVLQMVDRSERDRTVELPRNERQEIVAQVIEAAIEQDQQRNPGRDGI